MRIDTLRLNGSATRRNDIGFRDMEERFVQKASLWIRVVCANILDRVGLPVDVTYLRRQG